MLYSKGMQKAKDIIIGIAAIAFLLAIPVLFVMFLFTLPVWLLVLIVIASN